MKPKLHQKTVLLAMGSHYIESVHRSITEYASSHNWRLTNLFGEDPEIVHQRPCDGIIAALEQNDPLSEAIIRLKRPVVDLSIARQDLDIAHFTGDNEAMGTTAADHFIDRGFRHFIWYSDRMHDAARLRFHGYKSRLQACGYTCKQLIVKEAFPKKTYSWEMMRDWIIATLEASGTPCAVYAYNDNLAVDVIDSCASSDIRVPDEVAILGTDNHPLICPTAAIPLSSINHDLRSLGWQAAEELQLLMQGAKPSHKVILVPHKGVTERLSTNVFAINDPQVVKALRFMHQNFQHGIDVDSIVKSSGVSRRQLERGFQIHLKSTILAKLGEQRLKNVCLQLRETDLTIADIAARSGYRTAEYLHRTFKKKYAMTPRKYRLQYQLR